MKPQDYTKDKEIEAIENLVDMDGYFAQYLAEIIGINTEQIAENIRNDSAFECGSTHSGRIGELKARLKAELKELENRRVGALLCLLSYVNDRGEEIIVSEVGRLRVIQSKRDNGCALTMDDIDYLLARAKTATN